MPQRPKYKRSCLNISMIPTITEDVESSDLLSPRRRRASSFSGPPPEIAAPAPNPPQTPHSEEQAPQQQVRKRATEPNMRKFVVVTEATRVYNVYGRVYLDDMPPPPPPSVQSDDSDSDYGSVSDTSELVDPNEQVFLTMKARRRMAARANKRARKSLQAPAPPPQRIGQVYAKAGSTTAEVATTVNVAGDGHSHTTDSLDQPETNGVEVEAACIEQQHAEKLDEIARSLEKMSLIPKKKDSTVKSPAKNFNPTPGAGRIYIGKDLRLTAEMLDKIPEDRHWDSIRRWVDMMLQRLGDLYDAVYETNLRCSDLCFAIASAECDVGFAREIGDVEVEREAQSMVNSLKARKGNIVTRRERFRKEANSERQLYKSYYRDLMDTLDHPELERPVEESFDPSNPFKSFSYPV